MFAGGISLGLGSNAVLRDNFSQCPRCGSGAPVIDGALEILERGIRLFSGPDFTREVLEALEIAVEDLRAGVKPASVIVREVGNVSPSLAKELREWINCGSGFVTAMATAALAVFAWCALPSGQNRTVEEVAVDAFESVYEQVQPVIRQPPPFVQRYNVDQQRNDQAPNRKTRRAQAAKKREKPLH